MNKLPMAMLAGAMAISFSALAAQPVTQNSQPKAKDCAELSGKKKDKCVQATPAGPVNMTTGKQKKGQSQIAKSRDRGKNSAAEAGQRPPTEDATAASTATGAPTERTR